MLNKKLILTIILCSIFAIGTLNTIDTVESTKWKKYDSGTIKIKKNVSFNYKTYIKDSNQIRVDVSYKKILLTKTYLTKNKTGINAITKDNKNKTKEKKFTITKMDLKTFYKHYKKGYKLI